MIRLIVCFVKLAALRPDQFRRKLDEPAYRALLDQLQAMTRASDYVCSNVLDVELASQLPLMRTGANRPDAIVELRWPTGTQPPSTVDDAQLQDLLASLRALEASFVDRSRSFAYFVAG